MIVAIQRGGKELGRGTDLYPSRVRRPCEHRCRSTSINAPEVAVLGVSRAQMRPIWNGKEFCPRLMLPLMLSWDHRVVDGVAAALFLHCLSELLADLRKVLL